jgi:tetratricopeptide (TPR) repeat protein
MTDEPRSASLEDLADAVEGAPDDPILRLEYGLALEAAGNLDAAAYQLLQAERRAPDTGAILRAAGIVFYKKGLYDKAAQFLGRATKVAPDDARAFYSLGVVHDARRDPGAAIAAFREAIRLDPGFLDARRTLVDALAVLGEHAQAIAAIDELLSVHPRDEQAALNREVLRDTLEHMIEHRLLGKADAELERSALVAEGAFKRKGRLPDGAVRYANKYADLLVSYDASAAAPSIKTLMLLLPDPQRASTARDSAFGVTVVGRDGRRAPADYATAVSLTFLREALGVPLTQAGLYYQRLLGGEARIEVGGAAVRFASRPHPTKEGEEQHGLLCELAPGLSLVGKVP